MGKKENLKKISRYPSPRWATELGDQGWRGDPAGIRGPDGLKGEKKLKAGIRGPDGQNTYKRSHNQKTFAKENYIEIENGQKIGAIKKYEKTNHFKGIKQNFAGFLKKKWTINSSLELRAGKCSRKKDRVKISSVSKLLPLENKKWRQQQIAAL